MILSSPCLFSVANDFQGGNPKLQLPSEHANPSASFFLLGVSVHSSSCCLFLPLPPIEAPHVYSAAATKNCIYYTSGVITTECQQPVARERNAHEFVDLRGLNNAVWWGYSRRISETTVEIEW